MTIRENEPTATERLTCETIGENVRRLRREQGMRLDEAAAHAGINHVTWRNIEHGRANPTIRTLARAALALGIEVADLFSPG